ncbi:FadR family transcriptional regulator [Mycobacterium sp. CBMA293]|uniref:FadR/GntR family transcriptional regulator n=1 Tax=unclassified Mycolicibacterium TaxID=2636767 RepID=UPI001324A49C|nr:MULTISPECIES: FCD domain-containing protein [unclassified Mycolicibacterium]MUL48641.1 FadR family transcriptional regulator [Mycolicibacterium sp. CBMA 360]MUL95802.1 FadR family transcriptional regulator [Mycolicibacterium sp. CBMA 230]MUL60861.1 FadR family transcriptional regulator [Mycolicibacterium sp. CBMA 335]MUL71874.1 FadR family transcriptional regulator [Mycolicibacterium sp. CBMA 311]MUM06400.1 GntR family transcriptional regulator [Mycolicibacterium sp. CBMA 213]
MAVPDVRFRRLAEQVADELRQRILSGDLADGGVLPTEDELLVEFPISKPSLREAIRILETEGLLSVRRGKLGGSVVHRPSATNVAYTMGLVLGAHDVSLSDVGTALQQVEPACAALCAQRRDRKRAVVPVLRQIHAEAVESVEDLVLVTTASRRFHEALVQHCGNETMIILAGALETLWSSHELSWSRQFTDHASIPVDERRAALEEHRTLIDAIEAGDAERARELAARHLLDAQHYPGAAGVVDPSTVRTRTRSS